MPKTFASQPEPATNHMPAEPFWATPRSTRRKVKDKFRNEPGSELDRERAERLPKETSAALKGQVRRRGAASGASPRRAVVGGDRHVADRLRGETKGFDARVLGDGVALLELSEDDAEDSERPETLADSGHLRGLIVRSGADIPIPPRGTVLVPPKFEVKWEKPVRHLSVEADDLLTEFLRLHTMEVGLWHGLTEADAGSRLFGYGKTKASKVARELEAAGGARRWFRARAMELIRTGRTPRGRAVKASSRATAFFTCLVDSMDGVEDWLRDIGYRTRIGEVQLHDSLARFELHERELIEYLIQSKELWRRYQ